MSRPEVFVSVDIESDGPAPGLNSMLALGAVAFSQDGEELDDWYLTLDPLPDAEPSPDTMAWWDTQPEAWAEVSSSRWDPEVAIPLFAAWCEGLPGKPVAVAWPAAFDFAFVNYYCHRFHGSNPLGFGALDIRSYANGLAGYRSYYGLPEKQVRAMAGEVDTRGLRPHVAVDDAREQGRLFMALRGHAIREAAEPREVTG
jgi:hypothetical protein